ncbi:hypothetical protein ACP70R_048163 [Stipagrostis hirtigluma subsp. patula]
MPALEKVTEQAMRFCKLVRDGLRRLCSMHPKMS